jgi:hypothetical protein
MGYMGNVLRSKGTTPANFSFLSDTSWIKANSSFVEYDFMSFNAANASLTVFTVPGHPLHNVYSMRYALSVDKGPMQIVDFRTFGRSEEWKQNVLRNRAERVIPLSLLEKGKHTLRIYAVDPGMMLDGSLINLDRNIKAYGAIEETIYLPKKN